MPNTQTDSLSRVVEYLGAVEIEPTTCAGRCSHEHCLPAFYAWRETALQNYKISTEADLEALAVLIADAEKVRNEYSGHNFANYKPSPKRSRRVNALAQWLEENEPTTMPAWWSPERRFAYRIEQPGTTVYHLYERGGEAFWETNPGYASRITASLETGEEVTL